MITTDCLDPALPPDELQARVVAALRDGPARATGIRNTLYLPLLRAGDLTRAAGVNAALTRAQPTSQLFWSDRASLALRRDDPVTAREAATWLHEQTPMQAAATAQAIQVWLALGDTAQAAIAARAAEDLWQGQARLAQLAMTALYRARDMAAALRAAAAAVAAAPADLNLATAAAGVFLTGAHATAAIAALTGAGADTSDDPRALFELGRALSMLNQMDDRALTVLTRALALEPRNPRTADLVARLLLAQGRNSEACSILSAIPPDQRSEAMTIQLARALTKTNRLTDALDAYAALLQRSPQNHPLRRQYAGALVKAGQVQAGVDVYNAGLALRSAGLPDSFADAVARLPCGPQPGIIPPVRLDWLQTVLTRAARAPADQAALAAEVMRVNRLDHLMQDWLETRPDRAADLAPCLGNLALAEAEIRRALGGGQGAFLAAAHIGLLSAGPPALQAMALDAVWLASVPNVFMGDAARHLISTSSENEGVIGRAILRALRRGAVVGIAIDGVSLRGDCNYRLFDKVIQLSEFVPRLAHRRGIPSLFPRMPWSGQAMAGDVIRLPDARPGECEDDFVQRWMAAWLTCLQDFILEFPGSVRGTGGFWGSIAT